MLARGIEPATLWMQPLVPTTCTITWGSLGHFGPKITHFDTMGTEALVRKNSKQHSLEVKVPLKISPYHTKF